MTLYVYELSGSGSNKYGGSVNVESQTVAYQEVGITANSVQSNVFNSDTRIIGLYASSECRIEIGSSPTADNSGTTSNNVTTGLSEYMPAGVFRHIAVAGGTDRRAVIQA